MREDLHSLARGAKKLTAACVDEKSWQKCAFLPSRSGGAPDKAYLQSTRAPSGYFGLGGSHRRTTHALYTAAGGFSQRGQSQPLFAHPNTSAAPSDFGFFAMGGSSVRGAAAAATHNGGNASPANPTTTIVSTTSNSNATQLACARAPSRSSFTISASNAPDTLSTLFVGTTTTRVEPAVSNSLPSEAHSEQTYQTYQPEHHTVCSSVGSLSLSVSLACSVTSTYGTRWVRRAASACSVVTASTAVMSSFS